MVLPISLYIAPLKIKKIHSKSKYLYRSFESQILDYLSEYGSINRVEVEQLTGLTRTSALSLIHEFMDQDLIEKRGKFNCHSILSKKRKDNINFYAIFPSYSTLYLLGLVVIVLSFTLGHPNVINATLLLFFISILVYPLS